MLLIIGESHSFFWNDRKNAPLTKNALLVNTSNFMSVDLFTNSYLNKTNTPVCTKRNSGFATISLLLLYEDTLNIGCPIGWFSLDKQMTVLIK